MGKALVIVESPTKAKTLRKFLGSDYIVESSAGNLQHFLFLYDPLTPDEAKHFAAALKRSTGADCADGFGRND